MRIAIYDTATGAIRVRVSSSIDQVLLDVGEGEDFYLNCPDSATHIIKNVPEVIAPPPLPVELLLQSIRADRTSRLVECDWTQLLDAPLTADQKADWATYRQQLRDFPETCDPTNPVWPTPPN